MQCPRARKLVRLSPELDLFGDLGVSSAAHLDTDPSTTATGGQGHVEFFKGDCYDAIQPLDTTINTTRMVPLISEVLPRDAAKVLIQ